MAKDLVCGMDVDPGKAAATSVYGGQTYYFCSPACKKEFDRDPGKYVGGEHHGHGHGGHGHGHGGHHCC
ncbi:YHS domain-containing protein [Caldinitratiruptor microaerophilus]|uniref:TRASH domain-containing protein n=1 Tax=Caldinitratiruptor microaerophilus TaxID=671077 RepID=A0AA35CP89_9FIRM|nr:YHS domain-containing protein [Caldinitratiruptor microaerophilus]BDG61135.1 hypothetical protein caldi_22250 [Caldinitratiruptor microaerophilus]